MTELRMPDAEFAKMQAKFADSGRLYQVQHRDVAGRLITRFVGDIGAAFGPFMTGGQVSRIDRPK